MEHVRQELRKAVRDCHDRRLNESAKWAAQLLAGMDDEQDRWQQASFASVSHQQQLGSKAEEDAYQLALCHFDFRVRFFVVGHTHTH